MTTQEYETYERRLLFKQIDDICKAPLPDRQHAREAWLYALVHNPPLVAERVRWLLDGSYGKGAYEYAWEIARNKRMNRVAALGQLIAVLEWQCPYEFSRGAWKKLNVSQQATVNAEIYDVMYWAVRERGEEKEFA